MIKLLQIDTNAKTVKGQSKGFMTGILYLAPANISGFEVCAQRSAGCTKACLNTAGRGAFSNVQQARLRKTRFYFENRAAFMVALVANIEALIRKAARAGMTPVVRLNGTSDIPWERVPVDGFPNIMARFPDVQFYDYTKITKRALAFARSQMPVNYHLTFSLTEANDNDARAVLAEGCNVAAVYRNVPEYSDYFGTTVVNGDDTDLRFLDEYNFAVIIGLKAKGRARRDTSGFVR